MPFSMRSNTRKSKTKAMGKAIRRSPEFSVSLPATSANLGPGFDAAALAFDLRLKVSARPANEFSLSASGRDSVVCGTLENNLIVSGSSASARLAGIALANHFGRLRWTDSKIVGEASRREHHPDNAAACWMGGVAVAKMLGDGDARTARIVPKGKWPLLFAVPDHALSTEEARRVLPEQYSRADVVINIQNSMLLLAALVQGRPDLLASALEDRIHQPYRAALCPLLPALQKLAGSPGILGAVLSGAGPSVLVFLDPKAKVNPVKSRIGSHLRACGLAAELISTTIDLRGRILGK